MFRSFFQWQRRMPYFWSPILVLIGLSSCRQERFYIVESSASERVSLFTYYPCVSSDCRIYSPIPKRFEILVSENKFIYHGDEILIEKVFDVCGDVIVFELSKFNHFLVLISDHGRLTYLCDLREIRIGSPGTIDGLRCESKVVDGEERWSLLLKYTQYREEIDDYEAREIDVTPPGYNAFQYRKRFGDGASQ